jgi:hypothetical protein
LFTFDQQTIALIELIGIIVAVMTAIGIVIVFMVNLRGNIKELRNRMKILESHPMLADFYQYQLNQGVIDYYNFRLKNSEVEKLDD